MSKKSQRIKYMVGCRNALNNTEIGVDGDYCYPPELIKQILSTLDAVLELDGITPIPSGDSKVEVG